MVSIEAWIQIGFQVATGIGATVGAYVALTSKMNYIVEHNKAQDRQLEAHSKENRELRDEVVTLKTIIKIKFDMDK